MEIYKNVKNYKGKYKACTNGDIISTHRKTPIVLKFSIDKGYAKIVLCLETNRRTTRVHRVIAETFLENPENKPEVNHINGDKLDNRLINLEWCTGLENSRHAKLNGLYPNNPMPEHLREILDRVNKKQVVCTATGDIFASATDAAKSRGYKRSTLIHYLLGTRKNKTTLKYL